MIGSSVNSPICGVNGLFYLKVQCKITAAVFLTLRWYLSVACHAGMLTRAPERASKSTFEVATTSSRPVKGSSTGATWLRCQYPLGRAGRLAIGLNPAISSHIAHCALYFIPVLSSHADLTQRRYQLYRARLCHRGDSRAYLETDVYTGPSAAGAEPSRVPHVERWRGGRSRWHGTQHTATLLAEVQPSSPSKAPSHRARGVSDSQGRRGREQKLGEIHAWPVYTGTSGMLLLHTVWHLPKAERLRRRRSC